MGSNKTQENIVHIQDLYRKKFSRTGEITFLVCPCSGGNNHNPANGGNEHPQEPEKTSSETVAAATLPHNPTENATPDSPVTPTEKPGTEEVFGFLPLVFVDQRGILVAGLLCPNCENIAVIENGRLVDGQRDRQE